ncbi:MAG TPA: hypothetical protein GX505_08230 [Clostridiales bacterium]|nr:hypothetical protein [Clostridiales bacterium]
MKVKYLLIILLVVAAIVTAGFAYKNYRERLAEEQWIAHMTDTVERDTFYEGLYLDDVALGGLTLQEAMAMFEKSAQDRLDNLKVELVYQDKNWTFTYEDIKAHIDWEEKLNELYQIARKGSLEERYEKVESIRENNVRMETTLTMDISQIQEEINAIADSLAIEPVDAQIDFYPAKEEKFVITPESDGQMVDAGTLYNLVQQVFNFGQPGEITIEPVVVEAKVRAADLEKATAKIVTFYTDMSGSTENRMHNIGLALKKISGTKVNPGEVFSFNGTVGPRTEKAGFKLAGVIMPDKSLQDGIGGGICQASSTVFNAVALAGLEIVERYHHSFPISYLPAGMDATVSWGGADFKFRNNKNTPVFIHAYRKGTRAYVEIYGEPIPNNGQYKLVTELTQKYAAPAPKRVLDTEGKYVSAAGGEYEYVKSREGLRINTYRVLYENGKRVSSELLCKNYYQPIQGIIYYREPAATPKPTDKPGTTTEPTKKPEQPDPSPTAEPTPTPKPSPTPEPSEPADNGDDGEN